MELGVTNWRYGARVKWLVDSELDGLGTGESEPAYPRRLARNSSVVRTLRPGSGQARTCRIRFIDQGDSSYRPATDGRIVQRLLSCVTIRFSLWFSLTIVKPLNQKSQRGKKKMSAAPRRALVKPQATRRLGRDRVSL